MKTSIALLLCSVVYLTACSKKTETPTPAEQNYSITHFSLKDVGDFSITDDTTWLALNDSDTYTLVAGSTATNNTIRPFYKVNDETNTQEHPELLVDATTNKIVIMLGTTTKKYDRKIIMINRTNNHLIDSTKLTGTIFNRGVNIVLEAKNRGIFNVTVFNRWGEELRDTSFLKTADYFEVPLPTIDTSNPDGVYVLLCRLGKNQKAFAATKN